MPNQGFLPTRGSFMLDFVFIAMFLILPVMIFSIQMVKAKRYRLHRNLQLGSAIVLLFAVLLFEIDVRLYTDWRKLAEPSPLYPWCSALLYFHLLFALPTPFVWAWVIYGAMRNFPPDFDGQTYRMQHRLAGKIAAALMFATAVTGIVFYIVAFML